MDYLLNVANRKINRDDVVIVLNLIINGLSSKPN